MRRVLKIAPILVVLAAASVVGLVTGSVANAKSSGSIPRYDHVFLIINENENYNEIIGNPAAPDINALANDYGLALDYTGVSDPSEPNYVAMLGGSDFGINSDDPYFFPGHTVAAPNLMSQLEAAGETWKGYFQDMPYPGYRGYCYPAYCNGIPDSDTEYVAKHNGIVNFQNQQNSTDLANMVPYTQLSSDLALGSVPNFSYIVADECNDMHGAPPWCVDSPPESSTTGKAGDVDNTYLVSQGDKFTGQTVNAITSSSMWQTGNNAIVVTWDEGNVQSDKIATIVITNHGPRGLRDNNEYDHYSLLDSLQQAFGVGCLLASCTAQPMTPLFQDSGTSGTTPTLPPPYVPAPDGTDTVTPGAAPQKGSPVSLSGSGWNVVPSPSIGNFDNNLTAVSAGSADDVWAVGSYYPPSNSNVLQAMAEHFNGSTWTEYPLPNVGPNENSLLAVSELPSGSTWAVGYYVNAEYQQQTLVEHYNGTSWSVIPAPNPGARQNILYGVAAISDNDVWAVGGDQDANSVWHALIEHWDGSTWSVVPAVDAGSSGNILHGVTAVSADSVYAIGQQSGAAFPSGALVEHWNGNSWSTLPPPADATESLTPYAVTGSDSALTIVGDRESSTAPYTTLVASGAPSAISLVSSPNTGAGEQDLFSATTLPGGSTYAAGWYIDPTTGNHETLVEEDVDGTWNIDTTQNPGAGGDNGFAGITTVPGGGLWAVGITSNNGNYSTLIEYHS